MTIHRFAVLILIALQILFANVDDVFTTVNKKQRKRVHKDIVGKWYSSFSMEFTKDGYLIDPYKRDTLGKYTIDPSMKISVTGGKFEFQYKIKQFNPQVMTLVSDYYNEQLVLYKDIDEIKDLHKKISGNWVQHFPKQDLDISTNLLIRNDSLYTYEYKKETSAIGFELDHGGIHVINYRENREAKDIRLGLYKDTLYLENKIFVRPEKPLDREPISIVYKTGVPEIAIHELVFYQDGPGILKDLRKLDPQFNTWCYGNSKELYFNLQYKDELLTFLKREDVKRALLWYKMVSPGFNDSIITRDNDRARLYMIHEDPAVTGKSIESFTISPSLLSYEENTSTILMTLTEEAKTKFDDDNSHLVKPEYAVLVNGELYTTFVYESADEDSMDDLPNLLTMKYRYGYRSSWKKTWNSFMKDMKLEKYIDHTSEYIHR